MADITRVTSQLWTGGAITTESDVDEIAEAGITADIDCRLEFNDNDLILAYNKLPPTPDSLRNHPDITYLYDGTADDAEPKPVSWFAKAWTFAEPILDDGGVVLSHCASGQQRGPGMCYFLLRASGDLSGPDAWALVKSRRTLADPVYVSSADRALDALGLPSGGD